VGDLRNYHLLPEGEGRRWLVLRDEGLRHDKINLPPLPLDFETESQPWERRHSCRRIPLELKTTNPLPRSGSCTKSPAFPTPGLHPVTQPYPGGVAATAPRLFIVPNSNHKTARFLFEAFVERKRHPKTAAPEAQPGDGPTTVQRPTNENLWLSKSTLANIYK
jgi:hypothetical protein